jgi:hypothetical protein
MSCIRLIALGAAGAAALSTAAFASTPLVSDGTFIQAERCQALMTSPALGRVDASGIDHFLKVQDRGRVEAAEEMGDQARRDAAREASTASGYAKSQLVAERDGACQTLAAGASATPEGRGN